MDQRINRFKHCDQRFYPYIEQVLSRLPDETRESILNDNSLTIISLDRETRRSLGFHLTFDFPAKSIVDLNPLNLSSPDKNILYTIAHELAHHVVGKGETGLHEKEAERLSVEWGFEDEATQVEYHRPILESSGYEVGLKWGMKHSLSEIQDQFGEYYEDWNEEKLTPDRWEKLLYEADPLSILDEIGDLRNTNKEESLEEQTIIDDSSLCKGVEYGIMTAMKKKIIAQKCNEPNQDLFAVIEVLEEINSHFRKLYDMDCFREQYLTRAAEMGFPDLAIKVSELLDSIKEDHTKESV